MTARLRAAILTAVVAVTSLTTAGAALADSIFLFDAGFNIGTPFVFSSAAPFFPTVFDNRISSAEVVGNNLWLLYSEPNFQGTVSIKGRGKYRNAIELGLGADNVLSSLRPLPAPSLASILIFEDLGYRGPMLHLTGGSFDLGFLGFNDRVSSAIVLVGKWRLFDGVAFTGQFKDLTPGFYPRAGGDNRLTSLTPI